MKLFRLEPNLSYTEHTYYSKKESQCAHNRAWSSVSKKQVESHKHGNGKIKKNKMISFGKFLEVCDDDIIIQLLTFGILFIAQSFIKKRCVED
jgi:hypothetical protein